MTIQSQEGEEFSQVWLGVADSINQLPKEEREKFRQVLGVFMHDMKHNLGLIANANELIRRHFQKGQEDRRAKEMIAIIHEGTQRLDAYIDVMVKDCVNKIEPNEA